MDENPLVVLISDFVVTTPFEIVQGILESIREWNRSPTDLEKTKLLSSINNPHAKSKLADLFACWEQEFSDLTSYSFYLSIQSASRTLQISNPSTLELIWTGPSEFAGGFRRTDQALLELIDGAKERLLIVSFAVYRAQPIISAIEKAISRNVRVDICIEESIEKNGKVRVSGFDAFSSTIFKLASLYEWPEENRPHAFDGRSGSLHAKIAVADQNYVFISSANLTDFAMNLNMEMGVMIEDRFIGQQICDLFNNMILNSVLMKV
jgi:phosphatidylserine/phosphatidylglycerophosphate/cardiolipin synthase-like enzyme